MGKVSKKLLAMAGVTLLLGACSSSMQRPVSEDELIWSTGDRPQWTLGDARDIGDAYEFVGMSHKHATERGAREAAMSDARRQATLYFAAIAESEREETAQATGIASGTLDATVSVQSELRQRGAAFLQQMSSREWYLEQFRGNRDQSYWRAFVRTEMVKSLNRRPARTPETSEAEDAPEQTQSTSNL